LALGLSSLSTEGFARGGAVIGGLIVGAAIGAAVSGAINQPKTIYVPAAPPPQPWPKTYSPKPGITCYPAQQACYNVNGAYNANWTWKVYAR
jgi:hypothetical protein